MFKILFLLVFFSLSLALFAGQTDTLITDDKGDIIAFYAEGGKIVIKKFEAGTKFKEENEYKKNAAKSEVKVPREIFLQNLKYALRISTVATDEKTAELLKTYNENESTVYMQLKERKQLQKELTDCRNFLEQYQLTLKEDDYKRIEKLIADLEDKLDAQNEKLQLSPEIYKTVTTINQALGKIVKDIVDSNKVYKYSYQDKNGSRLVFNILNSYATKSDFSPRFVTVKAGEFTTGCQAANAGKNDENKAVKVKISRDFEIMSTEVTQEQWVRVMGYNPSNFSEKFHCADHTYINGIPLCPDHPVENLSLNEIKAFINRVNEGSQKKIRLPTEAEWEYAAKAPKGCIPDSSAPCEKNNVMNINGVKDEKEISAQNIDEYAWCWDNSDDRTHKVAQKKPNALGLYDMYGNVFEYVEDYFAPYQSLGSTLVDPKGPKSGSMRVIRGGGCNDSARSCTPQFRFGWDSEEPSYTIGFRLVREK